MKNYEDYEKGTREERKKKFSEWEDAGRPWGALILWMNRPEPEPVIVEAPKPKPKHKHVHKPKEPIIEEEPEVEIPIPEIEDAPISEPMEFTPEEIAEAMIIEDEPKPDPKAEEIAKLKEQLANLQNVVKDIEKGE